MRKASYILAAVFLTVLFVFASCDKKDMEYELNMHGVVYDYSHFDACEWIIELDDGTVLEPIFVLDDNFKFYDGQQIDLNYEELTDHQSSCMAGLLCRLNKVEEVGGLEPIFIQYSDLQIVADDFCRVEKAVIEGDFLRLEIVYNGGCEEHDFFFYWVQYEKRNYSLYIAHDANHDECETLINLEISVDLRSIQDSNTNSVTFHLKVNSDESDYHNEFTYNY